MRGFFVLLLFYGVGVAGAKWLHIPIPGNMLGMLLLAGCLLTGMVKVETVEKAASFFMRHMLLFFIPILIGVTAYFPLLKGQMSPILFALLLGPPLVMIVTGWIVQWGSSRLVKKDTEIEPIHKQEGA
ncbi:CidA/LrgA family protein [Brevibacillus migulae]|uniref:CidA/LrgA family protein n=1 Tax=Brevibacillus migulae TaxID=1644114 RepID=UPI00142FEBDF|nr:CidA/LrgA family protein [Brevibacillus migulae]